jgi:hypothetical protein
MRVIFPDSRPYGPESSNAALGILVCERRNGNPPFAESTFIRRLHLISANIGMRLFAFAPWTWDEKSDSVKGWTWSQGQQRWESSDQMLPSVVYDRSWPETQEEKQRYRISLHRILAVRKLTFLNGRLPNKGKVYEFLFRDQALRPLIPPTNLYEGSDSLASWLRKNRHSVFLKPIAGSQGKRVISMLRTDDGYVNLTGRHGDNQPFYLKCENEAEALRRVGRWIGQRTYLMQPMLDLRGPLGEPFDLRVLMQKNKNGLWTLTGMAARKGNPGSVTSNLHGGGIATSAQEVLTPLFGEQRGNELLQEIRKVSYLIAARLEETWGRFAEIGLDFGIDRCGKLWFLEANSKPGRAAMRSAGKEAAREAVEYPLSYARSILLRLATTDTRRSPLGTGCASPGRVIHEFDHL